MFHKRTGFSPVQLLRGVLLIGAADSAQPKLTFLGTAAGSGSSVGDGTF